jgi:hypothetical protein
MTLAPPRVCVCLSSAYTGLWPWPQRPEQHLTPPLNLTDPYTVTTSFLLPMYGALVGRWVGLVSS